MNIFEALEKGGGRATLLGVCASRFVIKRLVWIGEIAGFKDGWDGISDEDLKRNDWIPYVPRGTCYNCGRVMSPSKAKHKEVFENVKWLKNLTMNIVYPSRDTEQWTKLEKFISMPPVKMTLEWEE